MAADSRELGGRWKVVLLAKGQHRALTIVELASKNDGWMVTVLATDSQLGTLDFEGLSVTEDHVRLVLHGEACRFNFEGQPQDRRVVGSVDINGQMFPAEMVRTNLDRLGDAFEEARNLVATHRGGNEVMQAALRLLEGPSAKDAKPDELKGWADTAYEAAGAYGSRYQREIALRIAAALTPRKGSTELALTYAERAEHLLSPNDEPVVQKRVLQGLAAVLRNAGKDREAAAVSARERKVEKTLGLAAVYLCYTVVFFLFWAPGAAAAWWLCWHWPSLLPWRTAAAYVVACLVGYSAFWVYFASPAFGTIFSIAVLVVSAVLGYGCRGPRAVITGEALLGITFLVGLLYLSVNFLSGADHALVLPRFRYFEGPRPIDHQLPFDFADALVNRSPDLQGGHWSEWHYSERPPLQTGVMLAFWPLSRVFYPGILYQCVGTTLQLGWIVALGALATACSLPPVQSRFVVTLTAFSGFVFFNSVYLWPKMVAGALILIAAAPVTQAVHQRRKLSGPETWFASIAAALALLAHGGAALSIVGMAIVSLPLLPRLCYWRQLAAAAAAAVALYVPWSLYQTFFDPNPGRLAKAHLAGVNDPLDVRPVLETVYAAYRSESLPDLLEKRTANFATLFGTRYMDALGWKILSGWRRGQKGNVGGLETAGIDPSWLFYDFHSLATWVRVDQRDHVFRALGALNVGWLFLIVAALRGGGQWRRAHRGLMWLLGATAATMIVWCLLEFVPYSTVTWHASYAMILELFFVAAAALSAAPAWARWSVAVVQIGSTLVFWVAALPGSAAFRFRPPSDADRVRWLPVLATCLSALCLLANATWSGKSKRRAADGVPMASAAPPS